MIRTRTYAGGSNLGPKFQKDLSTPDLETVDGQRSFLTLVRDHEMMERKAKKKAQKKLVSPTPSEIEGSDTISH